MLNLDLATTSQIQHYRDYCHENIDLIARAFADGLITAYERRKQITPYQDLLDACVQRLTADWAFAMKVAAQLA